MVLYEYFDTQIMKPNKKQTDTYNQIFNFLFTTYYKQLCIYAYHYVHDIEIAKELVQDAYIKLWGKILSDDNYSLLKSFLYTLVRNAALDHLRHSKTHSEYEQKILAYCNDEYSTFDEIIINELEEKITDAIEKLSPQCRKIFRMNRLENKTYKEIAKELQISVKAVEAQISKALLFLKSELKNLLDF